MAKSASNGCGSKNTFGCSVNEKHVEHHANNGFISALSHVANAQYPCMHACISYIKRREMEVPSLYCDRLLPIPWPNYIGTLEIISEVLGCISSKIYILSNFYAL